MNFLVFLSITVTAGRWSLVAADCGDVSLSDDGKTQSVEPCSKDSRSNANVTSLPGVTHLNLNGSVYLGKLDCSDSDELTTITAPDLRSIEEITLRNLSQLETIYMPTLFEVSDVTLERIGNSTTPSFFDIENKLHLAESNLESHTVWSQEAEEIEVLRNSELRNLTFPLLRKLRGNLRIGNNSRLEDMSRSFPLLQEVAGQIQIFGNISQIRFPKISLIRRGLVLNGSTSLDCDEFIDTLKKQAIDTKLVHCNTATSTLTANPTTSNSVGSSTTSSALTTGTSAVITSGASKDDGNSSHRALAIGLGVGLGVPLIAAILAFILWKLRRKKRRKAPAAVAGKGSDGEKSDLASEGVRTDAAPQTRATEDTNLVQAWHVDNPPPLPLSKCQVRRSGSKFREHGLRADGREEEEEPP